MDCNYFTPVAGGPGVLVTLKLTPCIPTISYCRTNKHRTC